MRILGATDQETISAPNLGAQGQDGRRQLLPIPIGIEMGQIGQPGVKRNGNAGGGQSHRGAQESRVGRDGAQAP